MDELWIIERKDDAEPWKYYDTCFSEEEAFLRLVGILSAVGVFRKRRFIPAPVEVCNEGASAKGGPKL